MALGGGDGRGRVRDVSITNVAQSGDGTLAEFFKKFQLLARERVVGYVGHRKMTPQAFDSDPREPG